MTTFCKMTTLDGMIISFIALAASDFLFDFIMLFQNIGALLNVAEIKFNYWMPKINPFFFASLFANIGHLFFMMSTLTTALIATAKGLCVALPFKFKDFFTKGLITKSICVFIVSSLAVNVPSIAQIGAESRFNAKMNATRLELWFSKDRATIRKYVRLIIFFLLPLFTQLIALISVIIMKSKLESSLHFRRLMKMDKDVINTTSCEELDKPKPQKLSKLSGKEKTAVVQVVIILVIYIMCNFMRIVHALLMLIDPNYNFGTRLQYLYIIMSNSKATFECLNSSVNFYVYLAFNSRFRQLFLNKNTI